MSLWWNQETAKSQGEKVEYSQVLILNWHVCLSNGKLCRSIWQRCFIKVLDGKRLVWRIINSFIKGIRSSTKGSGQEIWNFTAITQCFNHFRGSVIRTRKRRALPLALWMTYYGKQFLEDSIVRPNVIYLRLTLISPLDLILTNASRWKDSVIWAPVVFVKYKSGIQMNDFAVS